MIDINYTLLIQAVIFIIFVFLTNQFLFRPVVRLLEKRKEATTGSQEKALALQQRAEDDAALFEEKLARARQDAAFERDGIRKDVLEEQKVVIERAKRAIDTDVPALREKALNEAKKVEEILRKELEPLAKQIAEKVLGSAG